MAGIVIHTESKKIIINKRHHNESPSPITREKGGLHTGNPEEDHTPIHHPETAEAMIPMIHTEEVPTGQDPGHPPTEDNPTTARGTKTLI